jgi:hypothetical protein
MSVRFNDCYRQLPCEPSAAFPGRFSVFRSVIPVTLINKNDSSKKVNYLTLIDSGADVCLFFAEIGELIGLDISAGRLLPINGIGNHPISAYFQDVKLNIGGHELSVMPDFRKNCRT